jgi:hypothetical protein
MGWTVPLGVARFVAANRLGAEGEVGDDRGMDAEAKVAHRIRTKGAWRTMSLRTLLRWTELLWIRYFFSVWARKSMRYCFQTVATV